MFKNSLQAENAGTPWGVIGGAVAFTMLMVVAYMVVNPIM